MTSQRGLTLIEVVVALGIFSTVLFLSNSIFTRFILNERRDISEQELQEDIRLAIELFAREVRTAYGASFALQEGSASGEAGTLFIFRDQNGACIAHRRGATSWQRAQQDTTRECDQISFNNFVPLTGDRTRIKNLDFKIPVDIAQGDTLNAQGFVTVIIAASGKGSSVPPVILQTTLTSRQLSGYTP